MKNINQIFRKYSMNNAWRESFVKRCLNLRNREEDISKFFSEEEQKILSNPKFDQGYAIEKSYSHALSIAPNLSLIEL